MEEAKEQLLQRFLDGQCTEEERRRVGIILNTQEGQNLLENIIRQRESTAWNNPPEPDSDMQHHVLDKLETIQRRIAAHENEQRPVKRLSHWNKSLRAVAVWAGLFMLVGLTIWQFKKNALFSTAEVNYVELTNPKGVPATYTLPDGTEIYLAAGSVLKYPESFPQSGRDVLLSGEAFFDVQRDETLPFTIRSGSLETTVLGTSFRVTAFEEQQLEVAVATGKVSVSAVQDKGTTELALLTAGLKVTFDPATGKATRGNIDVYDLEQWKNGELKIDEQPMGQIAKELERRYGIKLVFADTEVANSQVSGTFSASEPVASVLDMLGFVGKFTIQSSADAKQFTIYKTE